MPIIVGLFAWQNRCPTCGRRLRSDGTCERCAHVGQLATELQAAMLLARYCGFRCERTANGAWLVAADATTATGDRRTAVLRGSTLLVMAEKRLPPNIWPG